MNQSTLLANSRLLPVRIRLQHESKCVTVRTRIFFQCALHSSMNQSVFLYDARLLPLQHESEPLCVQTRVFCSCALDSCMNSKYFTAQARGQSFMEDFRICDGAAA